MDEHSLKVIVVLVIVVMMLFLIVVIPAQVDGFYVTQTSDGEVLVWTSITTKPDVACVINLPIEEAHKFVMQLNTNAQ